MVDVPTKKVAKSANPLVIARQWVKTRQLGGDETDDNYNPFENRNIAHPTTDAETLIHLLKGSLGSGILAMPHAFMNAGTWFGLGATLAVGLICGYCVHLLVKCAHILCYRRKIPKMSYADVAENSFLDGPEILHKFATFIRFIVNTFLVIDLLGCCCIYLVFIARNVKQVMDHHFEYDLNIRVWIVIFTIPMIFMCLVRNLKYMTSFSMIANMFIFVGVIITFTYIFTDISSPSDHYAVADIRDWPLFFGTVIFALEGIGVVMSLENDMKNPTHFIGCPSVLVIGMTTVTCLYAMLGFFGFLKYGKETEGSITLNLPVVEGLAQSVKIMIGVAVYFTFTLQFYVPNSIIWRGIKHKFSEEKQNISEYMLRVILVIICGIIAAILPNLGPFISLVGAVCLSFLGLIIPATIELAVYYEKPGYGTLKWRLWKNIFLIVFGIVGFFSGTYVSILEFIIEFGED